MTPQAWLVIAQDGFRAVFIDRAGAERYAAHCHGTVHPLFLLEAAYASAPKEPT